MEFAAATSFGNVCPYYEPDASMYGPGTTRPVGYTMAKMMEIFWLWNNLQVTCTGDWTSTGDCDSSPCGDTYGTCTCYAAGGATSDLPNPRIGSPIFPPPDPLPDPYPPHITTMSQILCDRSYLTASKTEMDGSFLTITIDCRSIACSDAITEHNAGTNTYYPLITVRFEIPEVDDGSSCDGYPGGLTNCGPALYSSIGTGIPDGILRVGSALETNAVELYGSLGYINPALICDIPHPTRCQGGEGYGTEICGVDDGGVNCPFCGQGPFCGPGVDPPCDDAECVGLCVPVCCSNAVGGCDDACITSGCYAGDPLALPCTETFNLCQSDGGEGTAFGQVIYELTIDPT